jgi:flagellar biosynthesis protein FlhB
MSDCSSLAETVKSPAKPLNGRGEAELAVRRGLPQFPMLASASLSVLFGHRTSVVICLLPLVVVVPAAVFAANRVERWRHHLRKRLICGVDIKDEIKEKDRDLLIKSCIRALVFGQSIHDYRSTHSSCGR